MTLNPQLTRRDVLKTSTFTAIAAGVVGVNDAVAATDGDSTQGNRKGRKRSRLRDLGIVIGTLPTGKFNAITDVPGVKVGYKTLISNDPGIARTGVTIIVPRSEEPIWNNYCYAGYYSHNGNGEMTGTHWIDEVGYLTSAIGITNTHQVGIVRDTLIKIEAEQNPELAWRLPVVAETYDGFLNDIDGFWVTEQDVRDAWANAHCGLPAEGAVGGGTGMNFFDFKGGSGTSSRLVTYEGANYTVGAFVQSNYGYGRREYLRVNGAPVGMEIPYSEVPQSGPSVSGDNGPEQDGGSCIIIIATDAPFLPDQCKRLAVRAGTALADTGGIASNGSGDIYLAFSTGNDIRRNGDHSYYQPRSLANKHIDSFFQAVNDATQEALHNSMTAAATMHGYKGAKYAIPLDSLTQAMKKYHLYGSGFPAGVDFPAN